MFAPRSKKPSSQTLVSHPGDRECVRPSLERPSGKGLRNDEVAQVTGSIPGFVANVLQSHGAPLDAQTRSYFEPRFGQDFSLIRVHADSEAAASAHRLRASAFAVGHHVVFGAGGFAPHTEGGRHLIAHELAHTVQQRKGAPPASLAESRRLEAGAEAAATDVAQGRRVSTLKPCVGIGVACAPAALDAYTDEMLAEAISDRMGNAQADRSSGSGLEALQAEAEARARSAALVEAQALVARLDRALEQNDEEVEPSAEPMRPADPLAVTLPPQFQSPYWTEEKREQGDSEAIHALEEKHRGERFARARVYLAEHRLMRWDLMDVLLRFLNMNDLMVLRAHGFEAPGIWTRGSQDNVMALMDRVAPPDRETARLIANADEDKLALGLAARSVAESIKGMVEDSPSNLAGRVLGTGTAWLAGKDPLAGGEIGAMTAGQGGNVRGLVRPRPLAPALGNRGGAPRGGRSPRPRLVDPDKTAPAPVREPLPAPDTVRPTSRPRPPQASGRPLTGMRITKKGRGSLPRTWANDVAAALGGDVSKRAKTPVATGTQRSGEHIGERAVPPRPPQRLDMDADPKGPDFSIPRRPGETSRQALARIRTVVRTTISDHPSLDQIWNEARQTTLTRHRLSANNPRKLFKATRKAFWREVRKNPKARAIFENAGFQFGGDVHSAPTLAGVEVGLKSAEMRMSLDHLDTIAQGTNWRSSLDSRRLQFEFAMPNTDRENRQSRHPSLRE